MQNLNIPHFMKKAEAAAARAIPHVNTTISVKI